MSYRTIAKFAAFVILFAGVFGLFSACAYVSSGTKPADSNAVYEPPRIVGKIANPDITEASGLAASKCQPDVFWTHNDSGDDAFIFAINSRGENLGTWRVRNAENIDWEDIAEFEDSAGTCFVYIGDIGDNKLKRDVHTIYRIREPQVSTAGANTTRKNSLETEPAETLNFRYADRDENAETLMVHPVSGDIYVLTKNRDSPSGVFKLKPLFGTVDAQRAELVADLKVPSIPNGLLTGGDISPNGRRVVICDYSDGYELILPAGDANFDDIWKQAPTRIDLGERDTGEAVGYSADGSTIYATTENKHAPIIEVRRK
jgi:hypothetical protein